MGDMFFESHLLLEHGCTMVMASDLAELMSASRHNHESELYVATLHAASKPLSAEASDVALLFSLVTQFLLRRSDLACSVAI
jgi:hypothetical protein